MRGCGRPNEDEPAPRDRSRVTRGLYRETRGDARAAGGAPRRVKGMPNANESYFLSVVDGLPRVDLDVDLRCWPAAMTAKKMDAAEGLMDESRKAIRKCYAGWRVA